MRWQRAFARGRQGVCGGLARGLCDGLAWDWREERHCRVALWGWHVILAGAVFGATGQNIAALNRRGFLGSGTVPRACWLAC